MLSLHSDSEGSHAYSVHYVKTLYFESCRVLSLVVVVTQCWIPFSLNRLASSIVLTM
jgi:hypothetical protein